MLNDPDMHPTRHARAAVGGLIAGMVGEPMIDAFGWSGTSGPRGGGFVAVVTEHV